MNTINQHEFSFERRRYGHQFYCWAFVKHDNEWLSLGDPWPAANWKKSELIRWADIAIQHKLEESIKANLCPTE